MSQAENLLDSLTVDDVTPYTAEPQSEGYIVIGRDRFITVPESLKRIAVQDDHNIETVTFECPRYWDENDLSEMQIFINYRRPDGVTGSYIAKNVNTQGDLIYFDWTIESHVTEFKGQLDFLVCTKETDDEGMETRHWNTELNRDMYISEGLEVEGEIVSQNPAIITDLLTRMDEVEAMAVKEEALEQHVANAAAAVARAEAAVMTATDKAEDMSALFEKFERVLPVNRCDGRATIGYVKADGSVILDDQGIAFSNHIPVIEGEAITLQAGPINAEGDVGRPDRKIYSVDHVAAYDDNMTILPSLGSDTSSTSYTVPAGVSYIQISSEALYSSDLDLSNASGFFPSAMYTDVAIVASETVIPYEEYFNPTYGELKPENVISTASQLANAIKGHASGEIVKIDDISPVEHNIAVKVTGKNLIPFPYANKTVTRDGITFTVNDDRSITVNGTATAATTFVIANTTSGLKLEHGVTYALSGKGGNISVAMAYKIADGTTKYLTSGGLVTWDDSYTFIHIYYSIPNGSTHEGLILPAPQFERGTVATDYVPYIGMEDIKVITCGKNMVPYPYSENRVTRSGVTYNVTDDGVIHANGTSTGSYMNVVNTDEKILYLHKGVAYRFSCAPTGGAGSKYYAYVKDAAKTNYFDYGDGATFMPSVSGYGAITIVVSDGTTASDLRFKPQLEIGTSSGEFKKGGAVTKHSPNSNGELIVRSVSPVAMIFTDAEGAVVECEYNKETSKAIEDVTAKSMANAYANALKGSASGEAIAITDASPIEHKMAVRVHKKNYLDVSKLAPVTNGTLTIEGNKLTVTTSTQEFPGGYYEIRDPALFGKTVTLSCSYEILEKSEGDETYKKCYASVEMNVRNKQNAKVFSTSLYGARVPSSTKKSTVTLPEYEDGMYITIGVYAANKLDGSAREEGRQIVFSNLQLEEGTAVTAYAPYLEDISTVKVKKYGKNLVDVGLANWKAVPYKAGAKGIRIPVKDGETFTVSWEQAGDDVPTYFSIATYTPNGTYTEGVFTSEKVYYKALTKTAENGNEYYLNCALIANAVNDTTMAAWLSKIEYIQVEIGAMATSYEHYKEPIEYPVSEDGTVDGVTSIYPSTTLVTDTAGAVIDCTYNRDLTKAFTELENKINTLLAATASV